MIKVNIKKEDNIITNIKIDGHAGYGISGTDIVCASVSSIVITSINAIIKLDNEALDYKQDEGFVEVNIKKHNKYVDILIENMISLLKELENQYKKYIKIYE
ncbi:MAG: ribosomal-processing cysteine protease Prp [Bacilli bacterium]|nr:ribosomal-processing cysteine protease Prp [Bacilli bacterium]